jgi:hypothetical protein
MSNVAFAALTVIDPSAVKFHSKTLGAFKPFPFGSFPASGTLAYLALR